MAKHRSLSNALLSPEKLAFIKGEGPDQHKPNTEGPEQASSSADDSTVLHSDQPQQIAAKKPFEMPSTPSERNTPPTVTDSDDADYRVAITTRLTPRTAEALRRAHLEQKLQRRKATQQEIVEAALQAWLREHAFLE